MPCCLEADEQAGEMFGDLAEHLFYLTVKSRQTRCIALLSSPSITHIQGRMKNVPCSSHVPPIQVLEQEFKFLGAGNKVYFLGVWTGFLQPCFLLPITIFISRMSCVLVFSCTVNRSFSPSLQLCLNCCWSCLFWGGEPRVVRWKKKLFLGNTEYWKRLADGGNSRQEGYFCGWSLLPSVKKPRFPCCWCHILPFKLHLEDIYE